MTLKESHVNWDSCIAMHTNHLLTSTLVILLVLSCFKSKLLQ